MSRLITSNGSQLLLFPSSFDCWLPQDHNVRFFDELIEEMDLSGIAKTIDLNQKRGRPAYDRVMMTKIVLYGYTVGIASARELEKACVERLDLRFLTGNRCPKYRGIARFKRQNLKALAGLHEQVLLIAAEEGLIEMKEVAIDGTKMLADASKHKAMSYQYMCNRELELKSEIKALTNEKNTGSRAKRREISDEIEFRKGRLNHIRKWKQALMDRVRDEGREEPEPKECGKRLLMTNRHNWSDEEIISAYNAESRFEQTFSLLKNPYHLAVRPQYHWTDQKVRVHVSICLIALLLSRLLHKIARAQHRYSGDVDTLLDDLGTVRLALLMQTPASKGARPRCTWTLEQRDNSILEFFKTLVPNKEPFVYTA